MARDKLKNFPARADLHARISECARSRGMTISGLHERILRAWLDENFFPSKIANSNK